MTPNDRSVKVRDFDLSVKASGNEGTFTGKGSVFNVVDLANEVVAPGALTESLADAEARGRKIPCLWAHDTRQPIGVFESLKESPTSLDLTGRLLTKSVARAAEVFSLMQAGAVSGLSIGYRVKEAHRDPSTGALTLTKLDLLEVSVCTLPCNDLARIDAVKMKLAHGGLPDLPEFESLLRDAGFSKRKAAVIANRGLKHLLTERDARGTADDRGGANALLAQLRNFSLPND